MDWQLIRIMPEVSQSREVIYVTLPTLRPFFVLLLGMRFLLGFAPDISHNTIAVMLPNLFFARLPGFPWHRQLGSNQYAGLQRPSCYHYTMAVYKEGKLSDLHRLPLCVSRSQVSILGCSYPAQVARNYNCEQYFFPYFL